MLFLLALPTVVGLYNGGTGRGWDFEVGLRADGTGTYEYHGCFDEREAELRWRWEGDRLHVEEASRDRHFNDGVEPYIARSNRYVLKQLRGETFLVPEESVATFTNAVHKRLAMSDRGRWPFLHYETPTPPPPKRPWLLGG